MLIRAVAAIALTLCTATVGGAQGRGVDAARQVDASDWVVGPIIRGQRRSSGVPLHPSPRRGGGWTVDIPRAPGSIHYITFPHGSLEGARRIVMRYRIEAAPGVRIEPRTAPGSPPLITLYFQRAGDNWSGRRAFETYRWYATFASGRPEPGGDRVLVAPLNANWTAVETSSARSQPEAFRDALAGAGEVGFVLGGGSGYGHGVHATGPARLVVTEFRIE